MLVYADAKMEPVVIILLVLALVPMDLQADTVKQVFEIFPNNGSALQSNLRFLFSKGFMQRCINNI